MTIANQLSKILYATDKETDQVVIGLLVLATFQVFPLSDHQRAIGV